MNDNKTVGHCFITGQPYAQSYRFGQAIILPLSQEADAHFVIRCGKDEVHNRIMKNIKDAFTRQQEQGSKYTASASALLWDANDAKYDTYIAADLTLGDIELEISRLAMEKSHSAVRILREMKNEFKATGKLTS